MNLPKAQNEISPAIRRARTAWCFYDWANSAFATTIMAVLFPPFFRNLAISAGWSEVDATALWGYVTAGTLLLIALVAPVLGSLADIRGGRKQFLAFFAGLGICATSMFILPGPNSWQLAAALFVLANFGFSASTVFYESLLPGLATGAAMHRLSTRAYGLGYAGGGLLLIINMAWVMRPHWFGMPDANFAIKASFISVAIWWAVFSLPLLKFVPEPSLISNSNKGQPLRQLFPASFKRLLQTFREIKEYRQLMVFLGAYWIYNDGIGTIIKMATAYGSELGIGLTDLIAALVLTQLIGIPCAFLFGSMASRIGSRSALLFALAVYTVISIGGFFMTSPLHFYILAGMVGTVQGGAQALSRSMFGSMVPCHRSGEFFGFFSSSGRLAGVAGPIIFALISQAAGHSRLGILSLVVFFVVGGWMLTRVNFEAGQNTAREIEKAAGWQPE